ncbi:uncharacterized protein LOC125947825 [Dermacentor silvarum]|uniref:uncharacterized protein LOC125947825 n=1 Tax=Dermacentor silvarum TaxID=543639 RepID=UPI00210171F8|nr:uncharacterized protein LOC125947825 [Dermacentor silvarum]
MGSRSTFAGEEDDGSFIDEYSVCIEVYETEVTDSGGSAPIIKISGLCDADGPATYLCQHSLEHLTATGQAADPSVIHANKDRVPRFQSLQVIRSGHAARLLLQPETPISRGGAPMKEALNDRPRWEGPVTDAFAGDANRKWSSLSMKFTATGRTITAHSCTPQNCVSSVLQCREQCSALGRRPTENRGYSRPPRQSTGVSKDTKFTSLRPRVPRSRKRTTIPSRLSGSFWDAEYEGRRGSASTYTLDRLPCGVCSAMQQVTRCDLDCIEETVTTRHLPAPETRTIVRRHDCETSIQEGWGCADLCAVYRILPPQIIRQGCQRAETTIKTTAAADELREVYVSSSDNVWLEALSSPFARREISMKNASTQNRERSRACCLVEATSAATKGACDQETKTLFPSQVTLPSIVTSLVDRFAVTCYEVVARLSTAESDKVDVSLSENLVKCNADVWNRVMQHVQERMAGVALAFVGGSSGPTDGMRGEGECLVERPTKKPCAAARRLSSRLDISDKQDLSGSRRDGHLAQAMSCPGMDGGHALPFKG